MTMRNGVCEFKSLAKAVELDTDWFRSVTSLLPKFASASPNGSIVSFDSPYTDSTKSNGFADSTYPCSLCGMVTSSRSRHVLNSCERLRDKYRWRKENVVHYIDSLLDHNAFKIFCNLKDRRTATGNKEMKMNLPLLILFFLRWYHSDRHSTRHRRLDRLEEFSA